ncbi:nicotianamine synthase family protein [Kineosporia sp. A_224]|uniref:nicotianamine synthase family protein n=1 Tax=Kineosporia sp. A_224 TaxID=1962180 RepID=UPI001304321E|nr:nicotianamine synthase family protein [Kineosporia sp. A_224]
MAGPARGLAGALADRVVSVHDRLVALDGLAPSPLVDGLFADLVRTCLTAEPRATAAVLADDRVRALRHRLVDLCARGETQLEATWAARVLAAGDPAAEVGRFPYLANYEALTRLEVHALAAAGHAPGGPHRVCFVGGGPLPLSALLLHRTTSAHVRVVDHDPTAVDLANQVLGALGAGDGVRCVPADAASGAGLAAAAEGCDLVVVAALVGLTREGKRQVLGTLAGVLAPGTWVLLRSADGLRTLLYPAVDVGDVSRCGFVPELLVHPLGEVVNSVLVARRDVTR